MQVLSAADLRQRGYAHIRRLLVISVDGQGTQDSSVARRKEVGDCLQFSVSSVVHKSTATIWRVPSEPNGLGIQCRAVSVAAHHQHCVEL
jgi:hypothetical protein